MAIKKYFLQNEIIEGSDTLSKSTDYNDRFKTYVLLTDAQVVFHEANPTASADEVYNCKLSTSDVLTNEQIGELRKARYAVESDSYFIAYQKNIALGDESKAIEYRQKWLDAVSQIDVEFPYNE